jgi:hypothetical protein
MTMALYLSVEEHNELADNIWLNTSTGSDYISQSLDEFRLVKQIRQTKFNLWIKLTSIAFCSLLISVFCLMAIVLFNRR